MEANKHGYEIYPDIYARSQVAITGKGGGAGGGWLTGLSGQSVSQSAGGQGRTP